MSIDALREALPDYAKDLRLNLGSVLGDIPGMTKSQQWAIALASAIASRNAEVRKAIADAAAEHLDEATTEAAKGAAAIMAMNNIYYRFTHLVEDAEYEKMPAKLRMNIIGKPGIEKTDFELISIAVSAVNGCGKCIVAHDRVLRDHGVDRELIQNAVRIASVIHAVAVTLEDERAAA